MDRDAKAVDGGDDPMLACIREEVLRATRIREAAIRVRWEARRVAGEVFVVPTSTEQLLEATESLRDRLLHLDWRVQDVVVVPVRTLPAGIRRVAGSRLRRLVEAL